MNVFVYEVIYSAMVSLATLLIGVIVTCWIYFQANYYQKRSQVKNEYHKLCKKLDVFRRIMGQYGQLDVWIHRESISDYSYHVKLGMPDLWQEDKIDEPIMKIYTSCQSFYDSFRDCRDYINDFSTQKIEKIREQLYPLTIDDYWDGIRSENVIGEFPKDLQNWLMEEYPNGKIKSFDPSVAINIANDMNNVVIPQILKSKQSVNEVIPINFKPILLIAALNFVLLFVCPVLILYFKFDANWLCVTMLVICLILTLATAFNIKRLFVQEIAIKS